MADPVTWMYIIGTAVAAGGAVASAQSAKQTQRYNEKVAQRNGLMVQQQAAESEAASRRDARRTLGKMTAGYGASGIVGSEGSPLDVLEDSAAEAELDALTIRYNGQVSAMGYQDDATLARSRGRNAETAGYFSAGSALISGGSQAYGSYQDNKAPKRT